MATSDNTSAQVVKTFPQESLGFYRLQSGDKKSFNFLAKTEGAADFVERLLDAGWKLGPLAYVDGEQLATVLTVIAPTDSNVLPFGAIEGGQS